LTRGTTAIMPLAVVTASAVTAVVVTYFCVSHVLPSSDQTVYNLVTVTSTTTTTPGLNQHCWQQGGRSLNRAEDGSQVGLPASQGRSCPARIQLLGWNGRSGNHIHQVVFAVLEAELCRVKAVTLPPYKVGLIHPPTKLLLRKMQQQQADGSNVKPAAILPRVCTDKALYNWQTSHLCHNFTVRQYRRVALQYARPLMNQRVRNCLDKLTWPAEDPGVLTVHLRGGDIVHWNGGSSGEAPCSMYEMILLQGSFARVHVVAEPSGPCVCCKHIRKCAERLAINYSHQSTTIENDFCTLANAQHLVLSFSTFAISAALISTEIKTLYRRADSNWDAVQLHSMIPGCNVWPGVRMFEYAIEPQLNKDNWTTALKFLRTFPLAKIRGPALCCPD